MIREKNIAKVVVLELWPIEEKAVEDGDLGLGDLKAVVDRAAIKVSIVH